MRLLLRPFFALIESERETLLYPAHAGFAVSRRDFFPLFLNIPFAASFLMFFLVHEMGELVFLKHNNKNTIFISGTFEIRSQFISFSPFVFIFRI